MNGCHVLLKANTVFFVTVLVTNCGRDPGQLDCTSLTIIPDRPAAVRLFDRACEGRTRIIQPAFLRHLSRHALKGIT